MSIRIRFEILAALLFTPLPVLAQEAPPPDAPVDPLKERAKAGFEKYNAGQYAEAIVDWEAVYRQSGREKGYRVAFNLARAYDLLADATRAGDYFARYLREVERRRAAHLPIEEIVATQEEQARARLDELAPVTARIRVLTGGRALTLTVDAEDPHVEDRAYVTYVAPGKHIVKFGTGDDVVRREVSVEKGQTVDVDPPPPPPPPVYVTRVEHPYSGAVMVIAGGVAFASIALPVLFYLNASATGEDFKQANTPERRALDDEAAPLRDEYLAAKQRAYASLAIPISLAAITLGLTAYYYLGARETKVRVARPMLGGLSGTF
jgi:hypothetical protein